jgi:UDP-N-acetylmuramoylalanine--D-glutamate ligase
MKKYAVEKANIFKYQTSEDVLLLNKQDEWAPFFASRAKKSKIKYFYPTKLGFAVPRKFVARWGEHNVKNLHAAAHAAHEAGVPWKEIEKALTSLPGAPFREEVVYDKKGLTVVNDSTATTPEATMAALQHFFSKKRPLVLITGGTDKQLEFKEWAGMVRRFVAPENLILLGGSATEKMVQALDKAFFPVTVLDTLEECVKTALSKLGPRFQSIILLSPSSTSFGKFRNEFDRGEQFNRIVQKTLARIRL